MKRGIYVITVARVQDATDLCLVNIYGPNSDHPNFFEKLSTGIDRVLGEESIPIIIAGDFNLTLNQSMGNFIYTLLYIIYYILTLIIGERITRRQETL